MTFEARFWSKVKKRGPDDCWEWQACKTYGYGNIRFEGRAHKAHRISFLLANGYWPKPCCCHSCDNRLCVNPNHLWEGTNAQNINDKVQKGRQSKGEILAKRGEANPAAKLTKKQVKDIRNRRTEGEKLVPLAEEYGVSISMTSFIANNKYWKNVA